MHSVKLEQRLQRPMTLHDHGADEWVFSVCKLRLLADCLIVVIFSIGMSDLVIMYINVLLRC